VARQDSSPERLVIWTWRPVERVAFVLLWLGVATAAGLDDRHRVSVQEWLFLIVLGVALWRTLRNSVVVSASGLLYRGLRDRSIAWDEIAYFAYGASGVSVHLTKGKTLWLTPTKPMRARRARSVAEAESTLRSIVQYAPEADDFAFESPVE
jgi:hypothetical protein